MCFLKVSNFCLIVYVSIFHYFVFMAICIILLSLFTDNKIGIENLEMSAHRREYVLECSLRFKCSFYLEIIKIMSSCFLDFINCKTKIFLYVNFILQYHFTRIEVSKISNFHIKIWKLRPGELSNLLEFQI